MEDSNLVVRENVTTDGKLFYQFVDEKNLNLQNEKLADISHRIIKRTMDISAGIVGIAALIPITTFVYVGSKISNNKGPIFYTQERIGKDGKVFKMYKYRTMVENADEVLEEMLEKDEKLRKEYTVYKKLKNDVRITKIGSFLRKTSLDETPQLINVLKGDMSLIGPRPYLPREKKDMGKYYKDIIKEKPGITGFWQVSGRSNTTFRQRLKMEKYYVENNNIKLDMQILIKTFNTAIKKRGGV